MNRAVVETFESAGPVRLNAYPPNRREGLLRPLVWMAFPVLIENLLHMFVGLTDVYLAGHLKQDQAAATAAIGTVAYILWFINLIAMAIATGATAIVARAVGAKHRSLANSVCGQSIGASAIAGLIAVGFFAANATPLAHFTGLTGEAKSFTLYYFRILSLSLPFSMITVAASACLRGAGDTLSPAIALVVVDLVNIIVSLVLTRGLFGLPEMGFRGIAIGTVVAYIIGGIMLVVVLLRGKRIRLHWHRLRPHWQTLRRLLRIGLPSGMEGGLTWVAQFAILRLINALDATNVSGAAHIVTIRVESLSFMPGLALMTATATLVGQSLGRKDPVRAVRVTWMAFRLALLLMVTWGLAFAFFGKNLAGLMTSDPQAVELSAKCLFITAFAQVGFASALVFGGALRGAGDTFVVMLINIISQLGLRLIGAIIAVRFLGLGLPGVWMALGGELTLRGGAIMLRFLQGGWKNIRV